ncbi:hypothetical protein SCLCIDRAFT_28137, partial [Scleroderma citrinum Foug A]
AAATDITDLLGVLAGWEPDDGSYDWECRDAILKWTFYTSVPISILRPIRKLDTADQIFKYLAKRFRDSEPIPHANEFQRAGTAAAAETPEKSPTSADAATERHASAERNNEDLTTTKALTRGTEDVDNGNVGRQDPRTKAEASAQGTSAKCSETTTVVLKSTPHEMQTELQNSLQTTPRLPIEDEPSECTQEAADSDVMAGRTNEMDADVDRMALLGGEPAERVHIVDEGDETEREPQARLQQTNLLCGGICQHNKNANTNIPIAYGLPLEGEWTVCASGEASNPKGSENASNAAIKHADGSCEHPRLADVDGVVSEGCKGGMDEPTELLMMSVEPYVEDGGGMPSVYLGGTRWRAGNASRPEGQSDRSRGQTDGSRTQTDTPSMSNGGATAVVSHSDDGGTYLGVRDAKRPVEMTDGVGCHADTSTGQTDAPCVETDAITAADTPQIVRIPRRKKKPPNSPMDATRMAPDGPNGVGDHADRSSVPTDVHSIGNKRETAEIETGNVRMGRIDSKLRNSPYTDEIVTPKPADRWKRVSADDTHVYLPWNAPVEVLSRAFEFGEVESAGKAIAPIVEGERAGDGDGGRNGGDGDDERDGDGDGTTSGGSVDSTRVNEALLAGKSQHTRQTRRTRDGNLPVSSWPPTRVVERPYGAVRRRRRRGRLKVEPRNVNQTQKVETTYLQRIRIAQPPGNPSQRLNGAIGPCRRRDRIKIESVNIKIERINDKKAQDDETAYLERARAAQPPANTPKRPYGDVRRRRRRGRIKIESIKVKTAREVETTYLERSGIAQPRRNDSKRLYKVIGPRRQRGRLKIEPIKRNKSKGLTGYVPAPRSHPETLPDVPVGSIDPGVNVGVSNPYLQSSVEREKAEMLT